jgi:hypothetical protein
MRVHTVPLERVPSRGDPLQQCTSNFDTMQGGGHLCMGGYAGGISKCG